jgi:serine/threonine protein kinase/Tol biopolymer transport system component
MGLSPGTRLGPYEIAAPLGAGGMGEVYRARDTRLDRTVAIKILRSSLASSPELKQRFEREARAISQLNHPHICTLYDVGHENGTDFLVMEFLEGESLADRVRRGALPLADVVEIGIEVAEALDKAHRAGILHRDLKPGNIMLTKTGAKLLDFGLAKPLNAMAPAASGSGSAPSFTAAPTLTGPSPVSPLTTQGTVLGTIQYMSPEQIRGKEADARSDIFSLGSVLYEMATGQRAFQGTSQIKVASAILEDDPQPVRTVQPKVSSALDHVVSTCLAKNPDERWQSAADVKSELEWIRSTGDKAETPKEAASSRLRWLVAGCGLLLAFSWAYLAYLELQPKPVFRTSLLAPEKTIYFTTSGDSGAPVLSPDGSRLAFVARDSRGVLSLYVRTLDSLTAQPLAGTEGAVHPFWAADSRNIGFFADGKLKRINANGGPTQELAIASRGRGGAWNRDGTILFTPGTTDSLMRVPAGGGTPTTASRMAPGENSHRWPSFLPDGKHFLFWQRGPHPGVAVGTLDSLEHQPLFENASNAIYVAPGYLLFVRDQALMAQPFSPRKLATTGDAVPLTEHVAVNGISYRGVFSASENGMLVYQAGTASEGWQMLRVGRDGKPLPGLSDHAPYLQPRLSPDGKRFAAGLSEPGGGGGGIDIWIFDTQRGTRTRLTFVPGINNYPEWTPAGDRVMFSSNRNGHFDIYSKAADGSGNDEVVLQDDCDKTLKSISSDGRYLAYQRHDPQKPNAEIWVLPLFGDRKPSPIVSPQGYAGQPMQPMISPDGKWLAYSSDESKRFEIYVTPFPGGGPKWQVSTAGGATPRWRGDGKELYFVGYDGALTAVDVTATSSSVSLGTPHELFKATLQPPVIGSFDVSRDGKQFLLNESGSQEGDTPLTLVTNWLADLKK